MSVFKDSVTSLLDYINSANNSAFTLDDITLSSPTPAAGTWRASTTSHNTAVKATAKSGGKYRGSTVLTYDRLNLADFKKFQPNKALPCYQKTTTRELASRIRYTFGLNLTADDIVDEPLNLTDGVGTVNLKAAASSLGWLGSLDIDIVVGGAELDVLAQNKQLDGINYPVADANTQTSALMYLYPYDFTAYRDDLQDLEEDAVVSDEQAVRLVEILKAVDKGPSAGAWNADAASTTWSVQGATVFYNGTNSSALPTNPKYKYVVGIELRGGVTTPTGRFYLQFSDPVDPNSV